MNEHQPFTQFRPLLIGVGVVAGVVTLAHALLPLGDVLFRENGILEDVSLGCWSLSVALALVGICRVRGEDRLAAFWLGLMALFAALRELDAQIWLNPRHLGAWGVRYRIDWWLSTEVSIPLRLGWAVIFLVVGFLVLYPLWKLRRTWWRRLRERETVAVLIVLGVAFLAVGYVIDDILRPVHVISDDAKQLIEETSEMLGAGLYAFGVAVTARTPQTRPG